MSIDLFGIKIDDPLLRPRKVAEMLGIAEQTLAVWRCRQNHGNAAPDLAWVKIGHRSIRYRLSDVEKFIDLNRSSDTCASSWGRSSTAMWPRL